MTGRTEFPANDGLRAMVGRYPLVLCDIWGVVHDGVKAHPLAADALERFRGQGGMVALITNAPRPAASVASQLDALTVRPAAYDLIITSGDVTRDLVASSGFERIFHLGPDRDLLLFDGLDADRVAADRAQAILCTGLIDDETETPDDYRGQLENLARHGLPMYCANPDRVVQRGDDLVFCAGALADVYQELGGTVIIAGKPHAPIYERVLHQVELIRGNRPDKADILAIGDGIATDIRGAAAFGLDVLFVTGGIHAAEPLAGEGGAPGLLDRLAPIAGLKLAGVVPELVW